MNKGIKQFWQAVKDVCFPPACLTCSKWLPSLAIRHNLFLCKKCFAKVKLLHEPLCNCCGKPFPNSTSTNHLCGVCLTKHWSFSLARSVILYEGIMAKAIRSFKYAHNNAALPTFGGLKTLLPHLNDMVESDLILPVPLHSKRLKKRGFNQALLLASTFFPDLRAKISPSLLVRTRITVPQTGLSGVDRRKNIRGAFEADDKGIAQKRILLVDDVFTTGTTVNECARVLCRGGASEVQVLTLARIDR